MARLFVEMELENLKAVSESWALGWRDGGFITRFEEAFADLVGSKYAVEQEL